MDEPATRRSMLGAGFPAGARPSIYAVALVSVWFAVYLWRTVAGHYSLATSAFDLSVFDYALWDLGQGGRGFVPFLGQSIFSIHFMPILGLLLPPYLLFQSPIFLLILQLVVVAAVGGLFYRFQRQAGVDPVSAAALLAVLLLARRTHGATAGSFYPECLQALLTFVVIAAWNGRALVYWLSAILLLMTKEDAAIYLAAGAAVAHFTQYRRPSRTAATVLVAAAWFVIALAVAIPSSRVADGLPPTNPLIESRFGAADGTLDPSVLIARVVSLDGVKKVVNLLLSAGGLSLVGPGWLVPAIPGVLLNLSAAPDAMQSSLAGHYAWPVLPWLFMAAATGVARMMQRAPRWTRAWVLIVLAATIIDSPAVQRVARTRLEPEARVVREALVPLRGEVVLAQPNLIPHLGHQREMYAVGDAGSQPPRPADLVLLTHVGDVWPLTQADVQRQIERYATDPRYDRVAAGPLHAFVRRTASDPAER